MFYLTPSRTVAENFYDMLSAYTGHAMNSSNIQVDDFAVLDGNGGVAVTISSKDNHFATGSFTITYNRINMNRLDDWPWINTIVVPKPTVRTPENLLAVFNSTLHLNFSADDLEPIDAAAVPPGPLAKCPYTATATNLMYFGVMNI
jgi:hypothetical protein